MPIKLPEFENLQHEVKKLFDTMNESPDFACVLIGSSYLDQILAHILKSHFVRSNVSTTLLEGGPLGNFRTRADICYCLGLISKTTFQNLLKIGEIRNKFAHSYFEMTLEDEDARTLIQELSFPAMKIEVIGDSPSFLSGDLHPRSKFNVVVAIMVNQLILTKLGLKNTKKKETGW